jgi:gamma-glutamylcyclotransferase (GGCT)/AIG2-like uncharacterized protein YtfP
MKNVKHILNAAKELGLRAEAVTNHQLFDGKRFTGTAVYLPGWRYPIVVEADGAVQADNYNGSWGNIKELDKLKDYYALGEVKEKLDQQVRQRKIKAGYKVEHKNGKIIVKAEEYA